MIKKIFISITVGIISIMAVVAITKAFTGPGSQPPTGNPVFWAKSGNDVYYSVTGGNVGIGITGPAYKLDVQGGQINSSGGLCIAGVCKTNWSQVGGAYWTQSGSNLYASSTSCNVGIGTTGPGFPLHVKAPVNTDVMKLQATDGNNIILFNDLSDTSRGFIGFGSGTNMFVENAVNNGDLRLVTVGSGNVLITNGNVGIGTTGPGTKLDVSGTARMTGFQLGTSATAGYVLTTDASGIGTWQAVSALPSGTSGQTLRHNGTTWVANSVIYNDGTNVGIGTASPGSNKLAIAGGNLDLGGNNITGVNKLTVNSIDPVFKINGKNYATYVSDFAGGLRVETSDILKISSGYEINFDNLEEGSNLWLFWQASNKNINDVAVILTPSFDGKVWYQKGDNKITIHTEKTGEISYRLSAPRIDNKEGSNLAEDQAIKGIDVLDY